MAAYVGGDTAAFRGLFGRYYTLLLRSAQRRGISDDDAADIVQQTFLNLHRARHDFRGDSPLRPWIFTICRNLQREHLRRAGRRRERPLELDGIGDPAVGPLDLDGAGRRREVRLALHALPSSLRRVVELHWLDGRPFVEVAGLVGVSEGAARVRAHRGYERLRAALAGA